MKGMQFPIFKTKVAGVLRKFMLEDPVERRKYFNLKAGSEIEKLREYLREGTFLAILLGPKNSGKGTYTKLFMEAVGSERVTHLSVGDAVRKADSDLKNPASRRKLMNFLKSRYRGFVTLEEIADIITGRNISTPLPTEVILALLEREIDAIGRKAIFLDGFPRTPDQITLSLYARILFGYRDDPDLFVFIDVPEAVIDERMKFRVVCPDCQLPRNTKLLRTKEVEYVKAKKQFYLLCDNPSCSGFGKSRMISKEGDEQGVEAIRDRVEVDGKVMSTLLNLKGVPKVLLRNSVPVKVAKKYIDEYEITPSYDFAWDQKTRKVRIIEKPWTIKDDSGVLSYSLLPPPVAVSLIKQIAGVLGL